MTRYLISFSDAAVTFAAEELRTVVADSQAVVAAAQETGVWVFGAGLKGYDATVVEVDGTFTESYATNTANLAGFSVIDVASEEEALAWALRIATATRATQEVRELLTDPPLDP